MTPEIERLLGGYATDTLTESERKLLFEAALDDQNLFNALEDEQVLRELLADEESRRQIGRALSQKPPPQPRRWWTWGLAAGFATAGVVAILVANWRSTPQRLEVAMVTAPSPVLAPPSVAPKAASPAVATRRAIRLSEGKVDTEQYARLAQRETADAIAPAAPAPATPAPSAVTGAVAGVAPPQPAPETMVNAFQANKAARAMKTLATLGANNAARFTILRRGADGNFSALPRGEPVQKGDSLRIQTDQNVVVEQYGGGEWKVLPPESAIEVSDDMLLRVRMNGFLTEIKLSPGKPIVTQPAR